MHVDPSDLKAGKKSGYFSNVLNVFLFPMQAILPKLLGFLKRLVYLGILFSEIHGIIYKKIKLKNLKNLGFFLGAIDGASLARPLSTNRKNTIDAAIFNILLVDV